MLKFEWASASRIKRATVVALCVAITLAVQAVTDALFPSVGVVKEANVLLTISMITREALRVLENNLTFTKRISRQYDDRFGVEGAKIGTTLNVRKPPRYLGRVGQAINIEAAVETSVPVVLNTQRGVDIQFSSQDLALSIDDFSERFIKPAIASVANAIDADGLALYKKVSNTVGTPGTVPNALLTYLQAGVNLDNEAAPMDGDRCIVINPLMQATLVDALKGLFQASTEIAAQYRKGAMGTSIGFDFYMDQNIQTHTVGPLGGVPLVDGANQTGATLNTKGWTAAIGPRLNEGDVFTVAGVYQVNPQSRQSTGALRQFTVGADTASDAGGLAVVPISPEMIGPGSAFQTVSALPGDGAVITVLGAANAVSPQGLAFHKDWCTLACADLPLPRGVDMAGRMSDRQLGMSIRMVRAYNVSNDQFPCRLDILYGWSALRPTELACRIAS